jgi:hypothetical protein
MGWRYEVKWDRFHGCASLAFALGHPSTGDHPRGGFAHAPVSDHDHLRAVAGATPTFVRDEEA